MIDTAPPAASSDAPVASPAPKTPAHWSYVSGDDDPSHWGALDPAFALCGNGAHQSPIDLPAKPAAGDPKAVTQGKDEPVPLHIVNNGHTVQVNDSAASSLTIDGTTYALQQFHFHVPSEHTVAGKSFDGEIHFVHKSADGKLAVIGMFLKKGKANAALAPVFDHTPADKADESTVDGVAIDLSKILPKSPRYDRYDGSLTVPPCTEGVTWLVVPPSVATLDVSEAQLGTLAKAMHAPSNRPLQTLHDRAVTDVK